MNEWLCTHFVVAIGISVSLYPVCDFTLCVQFVTSCFYITGFVSGVFSLDLFPVRSLPWLYSPVFSFPLLLCVFFFLIVTTLPLQRLSLPFPFVSLIFYTLCGFINFVFWTFCCLQENGVELPFACFWSIWVLLPITMRYLKNFICIMCIQHVLHIFRFFYTYGLLKNQI